MGYIGYRTPMAATLNLAVWGGAAGLATAVLLSFVTRPPSKENLDGLVYGYMPPTASGWRSPWYRTPAFMAGIVLVLYVALNITFR
jgi:SSS family solute:Na+ symporter